MGGPVLTHLTHQSLPSQQPFVCAIMWLATCLICVCFVSKMFSNNVFDGCYRHLYALLLFCYCCCRQQHQDYNRISERMWIRKTEKSKENGAVAVISIQRYSRWRNRGDCYNDIQDGAIAVIATATCNSCSPQSLSFRYHVCPAPGNH